MSCKFISFTKIGQYRTVVGDIKHAAQYQGMGEDGNMIMDRTATLPTVKFKGTVKLHGTNAGVGSDEEGEIWGQSRKNVVTLLKDNAGFAFFVESHKELFADMHKEIRDNNNNITDARVIIFGEWCGGNIQKGVALSGLDKMFVIFGVKIAPLDEEVSNYYLHEDRWLHLKSPENKIYNINDYESYEVEIDFNNPDRSRNEMIEIMQKIEKECPVGKAFGRKLDEDNTIGEGTVWVGWDKNGNRYIFKVKGDEHSASKVKTLAPVDIEKLNSIETFVDYSVTENRLNQAMEQVFTTESKTPDVKSTGDFIRWVVNDITNEEMDTMVGNNLEPKDVNKHISLKSRKWFHELLNKEVGL